MEQKQFDLKAMFNRVVDVGNLIELVKARPVIWDKTVEGYRNRDVVTPAWEDIYRIIFDTYDLLSAEQKKFIGKFIKGKWTNARDIWRRKTYGKQKEAGEMGENVNDFKDDARYEKLKFLAKVYEKKHHLQFDKEVKNWGQNVGNNKRSLSPEIDLDGDNVPDCNSIDFQRNFINSLMNTQTKHLATKKRKLENSNVANTQVKGNQATSSQSPVVINVGHNFKPNTASGLPTSNSKPQTPFTNGREINKSTSNQIQSLKCEQTTSSTVQVNSSINNSTPNQIQSVKFQQTNSSTIKKENPSPSNNQSLKNNPVQIPQKQAVNSPNTSVKQENHRRPSISNDRNTKPEVTNKVVPKPEPNEIKEGQTSTMRSDQNDNPSTTELHNFFQVILKPRIEPFNQGQMVDFFFEMFKPHIRGLNKHQLLDFQIEALQLVKKFETNGVK